jgi:thymidylate kinase
MTVRFEPEELLAAYLADEQRVPPEDLDRTVCDVRKLVRILQSNKVPLLSLPEGAAAWPVLDDPEFQAARRSEQMLLAGLRTEYEGVKEALAYEGIADVMIKSVGRAPSFPYRSDNLDVLYHPSDVERVRAVLVQRGYVELKHVEEPHKYLFRKFHAGASISAIHLHAHVGWMVSFLDERALWQRCRVSGDDQLVTVPAGEDALLTSLAHFFYEDKCVSLLDVVKCAHCLRQGPDWDEVYRVASMRGWRDGMHVSLLLYAAQECALYGESLVPSSILERALSEMPRWTREYLGERLGRGALASLGEGPTAGSAERRHELPLRIPFVFSKVFFYSKLLRDPSRAGREKLKDVAVHTGNGTKLRLRIHSQPRMLVTVSGVDGSGKTTQAEMLQAAFGVCHLRAERCWSRGGSARWLKPFARFASRREADESAAGAGRSEQREHKVEVRRERFRSPLIRWGWSCMTAAELLLHYMRHVVIPLALGRVVICDRYVYDTFADWSAYFDAFAEQSLPARILRRLTPRPQLAFWLQMPASVAQARSADRLPETFVAKQNAAYQRMADLYGLRRLDGTTDPEELSDGLVRQVLARYFAEYHTVVNWVFLKNPGQWQQPESVLPE